MLTNLPKDPVMLLSVINTKLRDIYPDFNTMCEDLQLDAQWIVHTLETIDYQYDATRNQFI